MAILHHIKINNFRGINSFEQKFSNGLTCIIGRGDSGKTSVLDAISYVFSSKWVINFFDSDFHLGNVDNNIIIEGTAVNISEKLQVKYGSHIRGVVNGIIVDDLEAEENQDCIPALTVRLTVSKNLEPIWQVVTDREQEPKSITSADRALLNCDFISDYNDKHFSLNKGNPLYALNKSLGDVVNDDDNIAIDIVREARVNMNEAVDGKFNQMISSINTKAAMLGVEVPDIKVLLDHKDITITESKISLHENGIPLRLKGKGTKRIFSIAIQLSNTTESSIILVDEIEQGLEPDRVQHLVSTLSKETGKQIIITTHSSSVITELDCNALKIMQKNEHSLFEVNTSLQDCVRANPSAFFARRILICEGKTEVGICRAINENRILANNKSVSNLGIVIVDGGGDSMINYSKAFRSLGYECLLFCDSDKDNINNKKAELRYLGITVVDCVNTNAIEQQIFQDASVNQIKKLIQYRIDEDDKDDKSIFDSVNSKLQTRIEYNVQWIDSLNDPLRTALGICAKIDYKTKEDGTIKEKGGWYKRIDHGIAIGKIISSSLEEIDGEKQLRKIFEEIDSWIGE